MDIILIYLTCKDAGEAKIIATDLLHHRLIACASLLPHITSWYSWQGALTEDTEALLLCKTTEDRFEAVRARVCELHSYEVPCIVAYPATAGHLPYQEWVRAGVALL